MVVLMVLLIIFVAIVMTTVLGDAWVTTQTMFRHAELRERNYLAARSVVEMAMELLRADTNDYDGFGDFWALGQQKVPFDGREFVMEISDEDRRFPLNQLAKGKPEETKRLHDALVRFMVRAGAPGEQAVDSVTDWIDPDSLRNPQGAEQGDYGPDLVKNGPLDSVKELTYIRGWENAPTLPPPKGFTRNPMEALGGLQQAEVEKLKGELDLDLDLPSPSPSGSPGLTPEANTSHWSDWVTPWSGGRINVNTAPAEVLRSLDDGMNDGVVQEIVSKREQSPLKSDQDLRNIAGMNADLAFRVGSLVGYKSSYFKIKVAINEMPGRMELDVVVRREGGALQVVEWTRQ